MSSLEIIDEQIRERMSCSEAEIKYKNCMFLLTDIKETSNDYIGTLYAISKDESSYHDILELERELNKNNVTTVVDGEYNDYLFSSIEIVRIKEC